MLLRPLLTVLALCPALLAASESDEALPVDVRAESEPPASLAGQHRPLDVDGPPFRNLQWVSPLAPQVTYGPVWQFPEQAAEADAAAENFRRMLGSPFSAQKGRSMLFPLQ